MDARTYRLHQVRTIELSDRRVSFASRRGWCQYAHAVDKCIVEETPPPPSMQELCAEMTSRAVEDAVYFQRTHGLGFRFKRPQAGWSEGLERTTAWQQTLDGADALDCRDCYLAAHLLQTG